MALIPNRPLFIVTSALSATIGIINQEDRLKQTIQGLKSLREHVPNALILLTDGSPTNIGQDVVKELSPYIDFMADFSGDAQIAQFAGNNRKSEAENVLMIKTLLVLKNDPGMARMLQTVNRIFKFSARTDMLPNMRLEDHNHFGKYVFKKRMPTWIADSRKEFATDLLITRMYSFCPSLVDDYINLANNNIRLIMQTGIDTEHAHFVNIDKDMLVELDEIGCQGIMAGTGTTEVY